MLLYNITLANARKLRGEKMINDKKLEKSIIDIVDRIDDKGDRRKILDFIREYQVNNQKTVDKIALKYGLEYHAESNSYWWV